MTKGLPDAFTKLYTPREPCLIQQRQHTDLKDPV